MRIADESLSFVEHLRTEHRHLESAVCAVNSQLEGDARITAELVRRLVVLHDELAHHFREEEAGGCIDEALSRCPSLSPEARQLNEQHPQLLEQAGAILARARQEASVGAPASETRRAFSEFGRRLLGHEAAENRIMQVAFGCQCSGETAFEQPFPVRAADQSEE